MSTGKIRQWFPLLLAGLALLSVAAKPADWGPDTGSIRGAVYLDLNRNGAYDVGEPGVGGVWFTASCGGLTVHYYSEPRVTDEYGNTYATGTYGPVLSRCDWVVEMQVPEGYMATTPVQQTVSLPGPERGSAFAYFGLYLSTGLPPAGMDGGSFLGTAALFGGGMLGVAVALGLAARRKRLKLLLRTGCFKA